MQKLADDIRAGLSFQGIEVASEGTDSLQLKTPGCLFDVGGIIDQIEEFNSRAVIDASVDSNGHLELVVTLPANSSTPNAPTGNKNKSSHLSIMVMALVLTVLLMASYILYLLDALKPAPAAD